MKFWEKFPRQKKFYNEGLLEIRNQVTQEHWSDDEVREIDALVIALLELLPTQSQKYCKILDKEFIPHRSANSA